ncbi:ATP-binding protein [Microbacterium marinilacus]|uniref:LuxR family transcriptional regulator n=1 Tax=Microbacterium marinilacus TaxID=415209 RepID=A0ABP7B2A8_9MICO|nr:helix-turn-helix transcriptional regulator [Microbacterium marinilacus]MBY0688536.1 AAA family ATPase [Microbacterium marinilacus]
MTPQTPVLIGREAELAQLADALEDAAAGRPRTIAVGGEAGIGKTRLLTEFAERHRGEARVLVGRCIDLGGAGAAYTSIASALRPLVAELGTDEVRRATGAGHRALQALFPQLDDASDGPQGTPGGLHEAIALLLERAAEDEPIVLVIEDLHWVDPASLAVLRFLTRALTDARILIVASYRSEDVGRGHIARQFLAELTRDRGSVRIDLPRLDREGTRRLMGELLGAPPEESSVDALLVRSDGVPFYIEELVDLDGCREDSAPLPDGLRGLLLVRYERLSDSAQRAARHLAVGGVEVEHDLLATTLGGGTEELDAAIREAVGSGVILTTETGYCFRHALVREAILDDVLPGERERLHERYASEYEARAEAGRPVAASVAHHWSHARNVERAFPAWLRAMREARAAMGYASAAQHAERALALWDVVADAEGVAGMPRRELMGRTATYLRNAGDVERSLAVLRSALADCPPGTLEHALLLNNQARGLAMLARPGAIESYREALATLDALGDGADHELLRADVMVSLAGRLLLGGEEREALELARAGAAIAHAQGAARLESVGVNIGALSEGHLGRVALAVERLEDARRIAGDDGPALLRYWVNASDFAQHTGDFARALEIAREGMAAAPGFGADRTSGVILASNAVDPLTSLGRWSEAEELIDRSLVLSPPGTYRSYLIRGRAWLLLWRGDAAGAQETLVGARAQFASTARFEVQSRLTVGHVATEAALALGDLETAWREAQTLLAPDPERLHPGHVQPFAWTVARLISRLRALEEDGPGAAAVEAAALTLRDVADRYAWWPTHAVWRPMIEAELSPTPESWETALEAASGERAPVQLRPAALLRLAEALVAAGDRGAARERLDDALRESDQRGVISIRAEAAAFGRASGLLRGRDRRPAEDLTDRERQVLELISAGLSNRQIGERLFISGKTASVHVSAILRKLGAANRAEAAHLARDLVSG